MSYQERVRQHSRPACWGEWSSYNSEDPECMGCVHQHTCRSEIEREDGPRTRPVTPYYRQPYRPNYERSYHRNDDDALRSKYESGIVEDGEKAIERFAKDCASGALRGLFYEAWQFFKNFRFR